MDMQEKAITMLEAQQAKVKPHSPQWMVGEQLKDICRREPASAELIAQDLDDPAMSIVEAEKKIKARADKNKQGNFACVTPAEAEEEARILLEWIQGYPVTYPVVFDWERQDYDNSRTQGAGGNTVTACALAFGRVISEAGYIPMTYGSPSKIYGGGLALEYLQDYPAFWLAHYTKDTVPTQFRHRYDIWQYSSSGQVNGIEGNVDLNICFTDWSGQGQEDPVDPSRPPAWLGG